MRPVLSRRLVAVVAVVAALVGLVAGCNRNKVEGEGRLDPSGRVVVTRDDEPATVDGSRSLQKGDAVEVAEGSAKVTLPGGDVLEMRPRSVVVLADGPELRGGNLLVTASGPARTVRVAGSQVDAAGITRIDVTNGLRVVSYAGRAVVRSGGRTVDVPALREVSVPVNGLLRDARALVIDRTDPWDQRLLGDAAAKEPDLESRARGFDGQVARSDARSVDYYRRLLPELARESAFQQAAVDSLGRAAVDVADRQAEQFRGGDVLLGSAIALQGRRGTFEQRLAEAADFRGKGATWALVSLDQQVPSIDDLLRLIDGAVNVAPLELAAPGPRVPSAVATEPPPARPSTASTAPARRTTPTTRPTRSTPTTTVPPARPQQPNPQQQAPSRPPLLLPADPLLDATLDPVADLLNDLLGNGRP